MESNVHCFVSRTRYVKHTPEEKEMVEKIGARIKELEAEYNQLELEGKMTPELNHDYACRTAWLFDSICFP